MTIPSGMSASSAAMSVRIRGMTAPSKAGKTRKVRSYYTTIPLNGI
jgi:hypothetical protein